MQQEVAQSFLSSVLTPVLVVIGTILAGYITFIGTKVVNSWKVKNEISEMNQKTNTRKQLLDMISTTVDAAIASNMQTAEELKKNGQHLTEEEAQNLHESAKKIIMGSLPTSLTKDGEALSEIIGGSEQLDNIIEAFMEQSVYEYKLRKSQEVIEINENPINNEATSISMNRPKTRPIIRK